MATLCKLCNKKIGFFDNSYFPLANETLCEHCHSQYEKVLNSINNADEFEENLAQFQNDFAKTETLDKLVEYLLKLHNLKDGYDNKQANDIHEESDSINGNIGPFENQDLVYSIEGVRGRHIDIYKEKVVITTKVTIGSLIAHNATDGEKTIYYSDCIGVQFKQSKFTIGYLQLETASSNGNNKDSNFFSENAFTYDTTVISNERMTEVANYVKSRVDAVKKGSTTSTATNSTFSVADELLKLKQLLDMGLLTQEEFDMQKNKLLNR